MPFWGSFCTVKTFTLVLPNAIMVAPELPAVTSAIEQCDLKNRHSWFHNLFHCIRRSRPDERKNCGDAAIDMPKFSLHQRMVEGVMVGR